MFDVLIESNPNLKPRKTALSLAISLVLHGLILVLARNRLHQVVVIGGLALMVAIYLAAAVVVARLGSPEAANVEAASGFIIPAGILRAFI